MARNVSGYAIFCDDIRQEVGGKTSYIGVYQDDLLTNAPFPTVLPKFGVAIVIFYTPRKARQFQEIPFKIILPGDEKAALEGQMPIAPSGAILSSPDHAPLTTRVTANVIFAPLHIKAPGLIRIEAYVDRITLSLGKLRVDQMPIPQATVTPPKAAQA